MLEGLAVLTIVASLALGPFLWTAWRDRRRERSLAVHAEVESAVSRALGGESLVTVEVHPALLWRPGQVILSAPADWRWLIDTAAPRVLDALPRNYELVVRPWHAAAHPETHKLAA
jgi:hypothetical protein